LKKRPFSGIAADSSANLQRIRYPSSGTGDSIPHVLVSNAAAVGGSS
jgi:hypothetical protein